MYNLSVQNKYGEVLGLTNNPNYAITEIDGLDPPESTINMTRNAGADGSEYNSSYVNSRQITITMYINSPAEQNRINLYRYFKSKFPVRLFYENDSRNVYIDGYVQKIDIAFFNKKQTAQVVINCPKPYFNNVNENVQEFINVIALFEFPFSIPKEGQEFSKIMPYIEKSIINNGDVETGVIITIRATGKIVNPKIYNVETREYFILNIELQDGDEITINTIRGEKAATLYRGGVSDGIVGYLAEGSTWFQLTPGDNIFTMDADAMAENMQLTFTLVDQFEGV